LTPVQAQDLLEVIKYFVSFRQVKAKAFLWQNLEVAKMAVASRADLGAGYDVTGYDLPRVLSYGVLVT